MSWLKRRLCEPSTWRGLVVIAGMCGWILTEHEAEAIASLAAIAVGLIEVIRKDS